jgi:hypothetical protein
VLSFVRAIETVTVRADTCQGGEMESSAIESGPNVEALVRLLTRAAGVAGASS